MKKGAIYSNARDFFDGDNSWGREHNNANMDNAALDAHWGAQVTYDYWKNVHRRNSYDDHGSKLKGYVHTNLIGLGNPDNDNAFWDGERMIYGDGEYYFSPVTSLDVVAHEIGHAITDSTAGLVYKEESGALNEGFSDIWAACIEHYKAPEKANWLIGRISLR
ncbi:MAG: M4 family metallopeptidase [Segetibacter sp.]